MLLWERSAAIVKPFLGCPNIHDTFFLAVLGLLQLHFGSPFSSELPLLAEQLLFWSNRTILFLMLAMELDRRAR